MPKLMYQDKCYGGSEPRTVKFIQQFLTNLEKKIARNNIGAAGSVNGNMPNEDGDITVNRVNLADNLYTSANQEQYRDLIFSTSAGSASIADSASAILVAVSGNCIKDNNGVIHVATPTSFRALSGNQYDKNSMYLTGKTIDEDGNIVNLTNSYVAYIHAVGGLDEGYTVYDPSGSIVRLGWTKNIPTASTTGIDMDGATLSETLSYIDVEEDGYICVALTNKNNLVVHPTWSGVKDTYEYEYSASTISIPMYDADGTELPTHKYGLPSVNSIRDEINLSALQYYQRIGQMEYSAENLSTVEDMGVEYIYDEDNIFYVLPIPIFYTLASSVVSGYTAWDFGTEEFIGTDVPVYAQMIYGTNIVDTVRTECVKTSDTDALSASKLANLKAQGIGINSDVVQLTTDLTKLNTLYGTSAQGITCIDIGTQLTVVTVNRAIYGDVSLGLTNYVDSAVCIRDVTNGKLARFWINNGTLKVFQAENYTQGNTYIGTFILRRTS